MKTHKTILGIIFLFEFTFLATAQDVILKNDNSTILSKVLELNDIEIKYKKWSNQDGPTYTIKCQEVKSITYQNGEVETFSTEKPSSVSEIQNKETDNNSVANVQSAELPSMQYQSIQQSSSNHYTRSRVQFSLNGGVSFPMGKFGQTDNTYFSAPCMLYGGDELEVGYGSAKTGFNLSTKLHIPLYKDANNNNIIGLILKFNFMYNDISDKEKKDYRLMWESLAEELNYMYGTNAYYYKVTKYPNYKNFAFMTGVDYTYYVSSPFALFAEVNAGINIASISNSEVENLYGNSFVYYANHTNYYSEKKDEIKYDNKVNIVYEMGAGFFLFNHISIGVFYTGYSPYQVTSTINSTGVYGNDEMEVTSQKLRISALSIQLGIHF